MFTGLLEKLSNTYLSPAQLFLMIFGIIVAVALAATIWFYIYTSFADKGLKGSHTILKCLIASSGPLTLNFIWVLEKEIPEKVMLSVFVISVAVLLLWNVFSVGIIKGALFTVANFVVGFIVGISAVSVVILAVIGLVIGVISFLNGGGTSTGEGTSSIEEDMKQKYGIDNSSSSNTSVPEYLTNVSTNQSYYVTKNVSGDTLYINGNVVVRKVDNNRYIDDCGNTYISYDD